MSDRRRAGLYAATLAFSTAVFAALVAAVLLWERADELDVRFVRWVHASAPEAVVDTMRVLTYAGSVVVLGPIAIAAAIVLVRRRRLGSAAFVLAAFVGSQLIDQALKAIFRRARPELEDPFVQLTTYAFPSGHAFGATATYGALALVLASRGRSRRAAVFALASALIVLVCATRVVLGVHYVLDVLAGVSGGVALICALLLLLEKARRPELRAVSLPGQEQPQRPGFDA